MKRIWFQRVCLAIFVLTIATCCLLSGTYAKYTSTINGNDIIDVARFGFRVTDMNNAYSSSAEIDLFSYANTAATNTVGTFDGPDWESNPDGLMFAPGVGGRFYIVLDAASTDVDLVLTGSSVNSVIFNDFDYDKVHDEWVTSEPFKDLDGDLTYDEGEPYTDLDGNSAYSDLYYSENYSDGYFGLTNGCYDFGEPYIDADVDGMFDAAEEFVDADNDKVFDPGDSYYDSDNDGGYDYAEPYVDDAPANGQYDYGESFTDLDGDGVYDDAESINFDIDGDGVYDPGEAFDDLDGDGLYDAPVSFIDTEGGANDNDVYDYGEEYFGVYVFIDENHNRAYDGGEYVYGTESFTDWNDNGIRDLSLAETLTFDADSDGEFDIGDTYTDWNLNGSWDSEAGENYADANENHMYDGGENTDNKDAFYTGTSFITFRFSYGVSSTEFDAKDRADQLIDNASYEVRVSVDKFDAVLSHFLSSIILEKNTVGVIRVEYQWYHDLEGDFDAEDTAIGQGITENTFINASISVTASQVTVTPEDYAYTRNYPSEK